MQKTTADLYETVLLEPNSEYLADPTDLTRHISTTIAIANGKNTSYVLLPKISLLRVLEHSGIYKVGGVTRPYACMEWPGISIPQALLTLREDRLILCPFSDEDCNTHNSNICFYERSSAGKGLNFDDYPDDD